MKCSMVVDRQRYDEERLALVTAFKGKGLDLKIDSWTGLVVHATNLEGERLVKLPDFAPLVAKGAALLDEKLPNWWANIDTSSLNLADEGRCILGQTWWFYEASQQKLQDSGYNGWMTLLSRYDCDKRELAAAHGFNISDEVGKLINFQIEWDSSYNAWELAWEELTACWLRVIQERHLAAQIIELAEALAVEDLVAEGYVLTE